MAVWLITLKSSRKLEMMDACHGECINRETQTSANGLFLATFFRNPITVVTQSNEQSSAAAYRGNRGVNDLCSIGDEAFQRDERYRRS